MFISFAVNVCLVVSISRRKPMNKFIVALATVVSLGLAIPAFAEDAKMPMEKMGKPHDGKAPHDGRPSPLSPPLSSHDETGSEADVTLLSRG